MDHLSSRKYLVAFWPVEELASVSFELDFICSSCSAAFLYSTAHLPWLVFNLFRCLFCLQIPVIRLPRLLCRHVYLILASLAINRMHGYVVYGLLSYAFFGTLGKLSFIATSCIGEFACCLRAFMGYCWISVRGLGYMCLSALQVIVHHGFSMQGGVVRNLFGDIFLIQCSGGSRNNMRSQDQSSYISVRLADMSLGRRRNDNAHPVLSGLGA